MNKTTVAKEIKFFQRLFGWALLLGTATTIICFLIFKPWKFDTKNYKEITGVHSSGYSGFQFAPYWWADGFFDYCDNKIGFNAEFPQMSYEDRKNYLIDKALRYGTYLGLIILLACALYRYGKRGQKWVENNSA